MPRLVVEKGVDKGKSLPVTLSSPILVGRDSTAGISISDTMASRLHFKIEARNGGYVLIDLNSKNGTLLNGSRVRESRIAPGDHIQVGETVMSFMEDAKPKEELIGRIVARRYKILERVGRGGMGTVYKAEQIRLNRNVALKMLQQELVTDPAFIKKFLDEARAAAQFNHANVVTIYEIDVDNELTPPVPFIAMEYLPGGSVQDALSKEKKLSPDRALQVILDAARGLEYAEKKSIVHRDIKPDNLMISEDGRIKIGDLGLAKSLKEGTKQEEGVFGTPHYIAPEQALNKAIDHRADIYSLGATFYRILAGCTPYSGSTVKEIIVNKLKDPPPPLDCVDPGIPKVLVGIVEKMMKKDPNERYATAKELIGDLDRARREITGSLTGPIGTPGEVTPSGSSVSASAITISGELRRPAAPVIVLTGAAVMLLGTVAVVAFTLSGRNKSAPQPEPPPVIVENDNPAALEEIARKAMIAVELAHKKADLVNEVEVRELIDSYASLIKEYPGTSVVKRAGEQIQILESHLTLLAADAVWQLAEARRTAFAQTRDRYATGKAPFEEVVRDAESAMASYNDLLQRFPSDTRAEEARQALELLDADLQAFRDAARSWNEERKSILELIEKKAYGAAEGRIKQAMANKIYTEYDGQRRQLQADFRKASESAFSDIATKIATRAQSSDFDGARALIREGRSWSCDALADRWEKLETEVAAAERAHASAEAQKKRLLQEVVLRESLLRSLDRARDRYDFSYGIDRLQEAEKELKDEDLRRDAAAWLADFRAAEKLHASVIAAVSGSKLRKDAKVDFDKIKGPAHPLRATSESLVVELTKGAEVSISWKDINGEEYRAVVRCMPADLEVSLGLVSTDIILRQYREAETDAAAAEKEAKGVPEKAARASAARTRATWAVATLHEDEARARHEQAKREIQLQNWQAALDHLNDVSQHLNSTSYWQARRSEMDTLAETCREKLKK